MSFCKLRFGKVEERLDRPRATGLSWGELLLAQRRCRQWES